MSLSSEDRLKLFLPARLYYSYKIAKEMRRGEPELAVLDQIVPRDCVAVDVGANRGIYSYALAGIADRVEAFEPNPAMAEFARTMLGSRAHVHEFALAKRSAVATLRIPLDDKGRAKHLLAATGRLAKRARGAKNDSIQLKIALRTLDSFAFTRVGFIKIDVEGTELDVIEGALKTIARSRPNLLVELIAEHIDDPVQRLERIRKMTGYGAWILANGQWHEARRTLRQLPQPSPTRNVLFRPN